MSALFEVMPSPRPGCAGYVGNVSQKMQMQWNYEWTHAYIYIYMPATLFKLQVGILYLMLGRFWDAFSKPESRWLSDFADDLQSSQVAFRFVRWSLELPASHYMVSAARDCVDCIWKARQMQACNLSKCVFLDRKIHIKPMQNNQRQ